MGLLGKTAFCKGFTIVKLNYSSIEMVPFLKKNQKILWEPNQLTVHLIGEASGTFGSFEKVYFLPDRPLRGVSVLW